MKYEITKNFYTRFILIPALAVMGFVFYCAQHDGVSATEMAKSIDNSMTMAFHVEQKPQDALAFIPQKKPNPDVMTVASK